MANGDKIVAYYDEYSHSLEDMIGDYFGVSTLRIDRGHRAIELHTLDNRIEGAIARFKDAFNPYSHANYLELRQHAISRYLHSLGYSCKFVDLRGYSQGDWAELVIYLENSMFETHLDPAIALESTANAIKAWFRGDIYVVQHERKKIWTSGEDTMETWETVDSIGGIMFEDTWEFMSVAYDYFDITPEQTGWKEKEQWLTPKKS